MAYHLRSGEPVADGVKRAASEELQFASSQLDRPAGAARDEAIHEARKSIKKVRGLLRLVRPELGRVYRSESDCLGEIGSTLSEFRDAGAIIGTFDGLREKYRHELGRRRLSAIRRGLVRRKAEAEHQANIDEVLHRMSMSLHAAGDRATSWPLKGTGFRAIARGLEESYRRGERAMVRARRRPSPENLHTWRKRVKDLWYHVRLLEHLWTEVMLAYEKSLKDMETWLGEYHNLAVLRDKLIAEPGYYGRSKDVEFVLDLVRKYQKELRANAFSLGERVYEEKPRAFVQHMKHLWESWQAQPKTLDAVQKLERRAKRANKSGSTQRPPKISGTAA